MKPPPPVINAVFFIAVLLLYRFVDFASDAESSLH
jgi:hypothetical protein